jgi:acetyltransferase-like isoleucine patch superfamily enzyme
MVCEGSWLAAVPLTGNDNVHLTLEDGATLGHFNHIYATQSVIIEKDVLTADKVYVSDNLHNYEDVTLPVIKQPIKQCKPVVIGEGSWLGEHVCVIGASVGKHCVVGANSIVIHDVPDYSVAVGAPAEVIKRYDHKTQTWERV